MSGEENQSLSSLLNAMMAQLDYAHPHAVKAVPEEKYWSLITLYMKVDPILASLFKQYCEAKENLGQLLTTRDAHDPMAEIAWDMHDSLRCAVETRLIELKNNGEISNKVRALQARLHAEHTNRQAMQRPAKTANTLTDMMTFMLWAGMAVSGALPPCDVRRDFCQAS